MNLLCVALCACGLARIAALQATTVPERAALLSLVQQVASPTALFQTSKADCRRVSEVCEALERAAALDRPGFPRDLMLVDVSLLWSNPHPNPNPGPSPGPNPKSSPHHSTLTPTLAPSLILTLTRGSGGASSRVQA